MHFCNDKLSSTLYTKMIRISQIRSYFSSSFSFVYWSWVFPFLPERHRSTPLSSASISGLTLHSSGSCIWFWFYKLKVLETFWLKFEWKFQCGKVWGISLLGERCDSFLLQRHCGIHLDFFSKYSYAGVTKYCTQHTAQCTLHTSQCTLHTAQCILLALTA